MTRAPSTALLTDHYELTMLQAALAAGTASRRSVFELFPRRLPEGRRYGVVAGVGRALDAVEAFRFDDETLAVLEDVVDEPTRAWLADYRFSGDVWGYAEGEVYFPYSPLLRVEASFAEAVLLETLLLSIYNHDAAIASAASRMTLVAGDRPWVTIVWNDPVNLMSYVTFVFRTYFGYPKKKAEKLMLEVHNDGRSVVSSGSREEMERDVQAMHEHGLWATLERAES